MKDESLKGETGTDREKDRLKSQYHLLPGGGKCCFKSLDGVKESSGLGIGFRWIMKAQKMPW